MNLNTENQHALILQQALIGSISSNVRLIYLRSSKKSLRVFFILEHESAEDREECDDLVSEVEALFDCPFDVSVDVEIYSNPIFLDRIDGRPIYMRKEH